MPLIDGHIIPSLSGYLVEIRLYEDDVIRLELTLARLEEITADFISQVLKGAA